MRDRAAGVDNAAGRQKVIYELYEEFFKNAFKDLHERLGIVYTPTEVIDFIIYSVQEVLRNEFDSGLAEKDVHIIDPFTGTGTFLVRLLQSGLISPDKMLHKYQHEIHANEIVLLAYYIATINIEEIFHGLRQEANNEGYVPFAGICLTDTFQLYESDQQQLEGTFPENSARVKRQKASPIRVVMANPPYSAQQDSENDNNQNVAYPMLDQRIRSTYAEKSKAKLLKNLYDSYIRAIRWASDRIKDKGVIGFVTNGSFIDANNMDGLRGSLTDEFTSIYVFNLRGNARTQGEIRRMEAGNVFGAGTRTPVAITLLVRNPAQSSPATLKYHDIGDYLHRDDKLQLIHSFGSIGGIEAAKKWVILHPNGENDWINPRDPAFEKFIALGDKDGDASSPALKYFDLYSLGVVSARDAWVYNMSRKRVAIQVGAMVTVFETERCKYEAACEGLPKSERPEVEEVIEASPAKISWTRSLKSDIVRNKRLHFDESSMVEGLYRPFTRQWMYFNRRLNEVVYQMPKLFPTPAHENVAISITGVGSTKDFSCLITRTVIDYECISKGQCFPLYFFERTDETRDLLFGQPDAINGYRRRDAITDGILMRFREVYGNEVSKDDIFYYVYGVLHSPEYRARFAASLKKMLPRIPLTKEPRNFRSFSDAGRELAQWHLNYETVQPWPIEEMHGLLDLGLADAYKVSRMTFARPSAEQKASGLKWDKTRIIYNSTLTITEIPLEAYDYVVNGRSAIEWIMERYQVTRDKDSGIVNDPNDWCREHKKPRYIVDLVARVVRVSMETLKIVTSLPPLNAIEPGSQL